MKKLLIAALLLTSLVARAGQMEDEEDAIKGEEIGMTLEGYRATDAYKAKKTQHAANQAKNSRLDECRSRLRALNERADTARETSRSIQRRDASLDTEKFSFGFRRDMLNAAPGNDSSTSYLRNQFVNDVDNYNRKIKALNGERQAANRRADALQRDIDEHNEACTGGK